MKVGLSVKVGFSVSFVSYRRRVLGWELDVCLLVSPTPLQRKRPLEANVAPEVPTNWFRRHVEKMESFLHLPGDSAEIVLGHWVSAKVPPGGKMAESRSRGLNQNSALVPPGGKMEERGKCTPEVNVHEEAVTVCNMYILSKCTS